MEIKELQERVDAWIREYGVRYFSELTNMACLTEEVGELARVMARKYGDQSFKAGEKENGRGPHGGRRGQFRQKDRPRQGASPRQPQVIKRRRPRQSPGPKP